MCVIICNKFHEQFYILINRIFLIITNEEMFEIFKESKILFTTNLCRSSIIESRTLTSINRITFKTLKLICDMTKLSIYLLNNTNNSLFFNRLTFLIKSSNRFSSKCIITVFRICVSFTLLKFDNKYGEFTTSIFPCTFDTFIIQQRYFTNINTNIVNNTHTKITKFRVGLKS